MAKRVGGTDRAKLDDGMVGFYVTAGEVLAGLGVGEHDADEAAMGDALALVAPAVRQPTYAVVDGKPRRLEGRAAGFEGILSLAGMFEGQGGGNRRLWLEASTAARLSADPAIGEAMALLAIVSGERAAALVEVRRRSFDTMRATMAVRRAAG